MTMADELARVSPMIAIKSLELEAKGFTPDQVRAGLRWAMRTAQGTAAAAPIGMRERSFEDQLAHNLISVEPYIEGCARAARDREAQRGVIRALRGNEYRRQIQRGFGVDPKQAGRAWAAAAPAAADAWTRKFSGGPNE